MSGARVFVTRRIADAGLSMLRSAGCEVRIGEEREDVPLAREALLDGAQWCDVLLSLLTERVDHELLLSAPRLVGVSNCAVGFNNIDVTSATGMGIPVGNTPGVLTDTTADLTWALLLGVARRLAEAHAYMTAGRYKLWGPGLFLGGDVSPGGSGRRKVLGIVGYGRIGAAVARRAAGFDMDVVAYDPYAREAIDADPRVRWADLDELLQVSDFVTLHTVLSSETFHMIGERELRLMKPSAYLVNVARGPVVHEAALVSALREGWIAGAALDVYEDEPAMAPGLAECPNALLVPHIASASHDTRGRMATMAAANALAMAEGKRAPHVVNPDVYHSAAFDRRAAVRANGVGA